MRVAVLSAAVAGLWVQPASAAAIILPATYVQYDTPLADQGFTYFDSSLGTLESVQLQVTPNFTREFQAIYPGHLDTASVAWDTSSAPNCAVCAGLTAKGEADLTLAYSDALMGSYDYFQVNFTGPAEAYKFNPLAFVNPPFPEYRKYLTSSGPGLYDESLDGLFRTTNGGTIRNASPVLCTSYRSCDFSLYQLTYTYAPGGVPEPSTWALMLIAFGAMGMAMRRRKQRLALAYMP